MYRTKQTQASHSKEQTSVNVTGQSADEAEASLSFVSTRSALFVVHGPLLSHTHQSCGKVCGVEKGSGGRCNVLYLKLFFH